VESFVKMGKSLKVPTAYYHYECASGFWRETGKISRPECKLVEQKLKPFQAAL
jgi:hypothetical protein